MALASVLPASVILYSENGVSRTPTRSTRRALGELQHLVTLTPDLAQLGPDSFLLLTLGDLWNLHQGLRALQTLPLRVGTS